jgi:hypothetical protein
MSQSKNIEEQANQDNLNQTSIPAGITVVTQAERNKIIRDAHAIAMTALSKYHSAQKDFVTKIDIFLQSHTKEELRVEISNPNTELGKSNQLSTDASEAYRKANYAYLIA